MFDLKDKTYAVLEFVVTDGYFSNIKTKKNKFTVHLNFPAIIEMAAVKIKEGKIVDHYSTFVGIDGCDEYDTRLEDDSPELCGITAEHLIGAPSFFDAIDRLFSFTRKCTLITKFSANDSRNPLHIVKKYMEPVGYVFNNPVLSVNNIITAIKIKEGIADGKNELAEADAYQLALSLEDKESYADLVAHYLDCDVDRGRQDSLSRALITARLFIALTSGAKSLEPIDEDIPF